MEKELREIFDKNNVGFGEIDVDNAIKDILRLFSVSGRSEQLVCVCKKRQDQFKRGDIWVCGDCEEEIKQTNCH